MTGSILHSASQVWLLVGLLSAFVGTLLLGMTVWKRQRTLSNMSKPTLPPFDEPTNRPSGNTPTHWTRRPANDLLMVLIVLSALPLGGMSWLMWRDYHPKYPPLPTQYGDVRFLEKLDIMGYSWKAEKADGPFRIDFCHDYDVPALNFQPGEVAWRFWFKDTGNCWSIKEGDVRFYRDKKTFWTIPTDIHTDYKTALREIKANE